MKKTNSDTKIKNVDVLKLFLFAVFVGMIPVSLNYIYINFDVPKELSTPAFVALLLFCAMIVKRKELPKSNVLGLVMMVTCSAIYSIIVAIDYYIVDFFEPNIYWLISAYLPVFIFAAMSVNADESGQK